MAAGSN